MTSFAGEFAFGCAEPECVIFIHHVKLVTVHAILVKCPVHQRNNGTYFYDCPDSRGGFQRTELER